MNEVAINALYGGIAGGMGFLLVSIIERYYSMSKFVKFIMVVLFTFTLYLFINTTIK